MPLVYKTGHVKNVHAAFQHAVIFHLFLQGAAEPHSTVRTREGGKVAAVPACSSVCLLLPHLSMLAIARQNIESILEYRMSIQGPDQIVDDPDQTVSVWELLVPWPAQPTLAG